MGCPGSCSQGWWRNHDLRPASGKVAQGTKHCSASRTSPGSRSIQTLRSRSWSSAQSHCPPGALQGQEVRTCTRSQEELWLQELNMFILYFEQYQLKKLLH